MPKNRGILSGPVLAKSELTAGLTLMNEDKRSDIAQAILEYLLEHPDAQDTLAGIAEWWLPEEKAKTRLPIIKDAVDQLAVEGLVLERRGKDSQTHYRINGQRLQEIEKLVGTAKPPRPNT
jgi:hypothetical protein